MTVGAYTTVLLSLQGVPPILGALGGMVLAMGLAVLMGLTTLRLREDYLAIVTIGIAEVVRLMATNEAWLTNGTQGLYGFTVPLQNFQPNFLTRLALVGFLTLIAIGVYRHLWIWLKVSWQRESGLNWGRLGLGVLLASLGIAIYSAEAHALYYYDRLPSYRRSGLLLLLLVVLVLAFGLVEYLVCSPWGRVLKAIREDPELATALGKNVWRYKLQSLMLGGAIAGLAGAFYAWQLAAVFPDSFKPQITFDAWTMVVLGGAAHNLGPILGAIVFWGYDSLTRFGFGAVPLGDARLGALRVMVIGLMLIVVVRWRPQGLLGKSEELTLD
jgi:neutral amino acid transport system permease protein